MKYMPIIDLTGQKFNRLTVIAKDEEKTKDESDDKPKKRKKSRRKK